MKTKKVSNSFGTGRSSRLFVALPSSYQWIESDYCRNIALLLKNSLVEIAPKNRRARKPYKRLSPTGDTFLVTRFELDFRKRDFFNSHSP